MWYSLSVDLSGTEMTDSPKHPPTSPPTDSNILDTIISSTNSVSARLKTLEKEHHSLLSELPQDKVHNEETANDFECLLVQEKQRVLSESMKKLHYGLSEAKVRNCSIETVNKTFVTTYYHMYGPFVDESSVVCLTNDRHHLTNQI